MDRSRRWDSFRNLAGVDTCPDGPATAEEIRAFRHLPGLTRADFARHVGVGDGVIKCWEEGLRQPTRRSRLRLAAAARREMRPALPRR